MSLKKKRKANKGITLIALVITIIILLILAGVSIAILTGENGILTKASESEEETVVAEEKEQIKLAYSAAMAEKWHKGDTTAITGEELETELNGQNANATVSKDTTPMEITFNKTGNKYTVDGSTGEIIEAGKEKPVPNPPEPQETKKLVEAYNAGEIKIGDYVDYKPISGKSVTVTKEETGYNANQTFTVDTNTTWRVLGLSEDGNNVLLISGSPITKGETSIEKPNIILQGAESCVNCKDILDKVSAIYQNDLAKEAKSVKIEDIIRTLGITIDKENNQAYKTDDPSKTPLSSYSGYFGQTYSYKIGDYAPENYIKAIYTSNSKYQSLVSKKAGDVVNQTFFSIDYTKNETVNQDSIIYDLLFKGTTESENYAKSYWLASTGAWYKRVFVLRAKLCLWWPYSWWRYVILCGWRLECIRERCTSSSYPKL